MFSTGQLENLICDAINIIVDKKGKKANYNTTMLAELITGNLQHQVSSVAVGREGRKKTIEITDICYKARYQDATFLVYPIDPEKKYKKGDRVLVLVPNNDMRNHKMILCKQPKGKI